VDEISEIFGNSRSRTRKSQLDFGSNLVL